MLTDHLYKTFELDTAFTWAVNDENVKVPFAMTTSVVLNANGACRDLPMIYTGSIEEFREYLVSNMFFDRNHDRVS